MDPDFINVYIDTLIKNLHDLTSKNVVLETKLIYAEKTTRELKEKSDALESQFADLSNNFDEISNERDIIRTELSATRNTIDALSKDLEQQRNIANEVKPLKDNAHTLTTEIAFLNNRVRELEEQNRVLKNPPVAEVKKTKTPKITDLTEVDTFTE